MDPRPPGEVAPGLLLGRYRLESVLGEGGLGTVLKAYDTRLKRYLALKTLKRSIASDNDRYQDLRERFQNEAHAGSRMGSHPNLVVVYDFVGDADGTPYLILEYVPGGTLEARIKEGPCSLRDALRLTADIARGSQAAHDTGIVHRDIKPGNIFIGADGRGQVGDFGIAQIDNLSRRTQATRTHPGTALYMSPEQSQTTGYLRPSSDQYSLGLVLFEMLTASPYKRLENREVARRLGALPPPVADLIERLTEDRPEGRYPSMATVTEVAESLRRSVDMYGEPRNVAPGPHQRPAPNPDPHDATPPLTRPLTDPPPTSTLPLGAPGRPRYSEPVHEQTPLAHLQPIPSLPVGMTDGTRYRRRTIMVGLGALALAGGGVLAHIFGPKPDPASTPTATTAVAPATAPSPPGTAVPAVASSPAPTVPAATPSPAPTLIPTPTLMPTQLPSPTVPPTPSPIPTNAALASATPSAPDFAVLDAGTTNEPIEPRGAQDAVRIFRSGEQVYGWVQLGNAPLSDILQIQVIVNQIAQRPQSVPIVRADGFQVFLLEPGTFRPGTYNWTVNYRGEVRQVKSFVVTA